MKVITASDFLREAADVLSPISNDVVVIGAAALQIVLADDLSTPAETATIALAITPTRDVDVAVEMTAVEAVVNHLEHEGLQASDEPHERGFTWIRGDLKVQLVRSFHPFPSETAARLPMNPQLSLLHRDAHRMAVAFAEEPDVPRLQSATAAALTALKQVAFGRHRPDGSPVERDYHDVYAVVSARPKDLESTYRAAEYHVRSLVDRALDILAAGGPETQAAARQHAEITGEGDISAIEQAIIRDTTFMQRRLAA